jgi:hypothetical protein
MKVQTVVLSNHCYPVSHKNQQKQIVYAGTPIIPPTPIIEKPNNNKKEQYKKIGIGVGAVAIALLSFFAFKGKKGAKQITTELKQNSNKIGQKISEVKERCKEEFNKILKENTIFGEIKLDKMDEAAKMRAADTKRADYLHEAANMAEEAYIEAYKKAKPQEGKNLLDRIFYRIDKESKLIPSIYAKMPKEEAQVRLQTFATKAYEADKKSGMSVTTLVNKINEFINNLPKA